MTTSEVRRLDAAELRTLFLFETLDDDKIAWLERHGRVETHPPRMVFTQGEPATCFFVLLSGTLALLRRVRGEDIEVTRTDQRGVYAGATQAYMAEDTPGIAEGYPGSMRAVTECTFFVLPSDEFGPALRSWFPMAMHLLEGLFLGLRASQARISERERLLALGQLSAGLTHELNNPAAAAVRATDALRGRVASMRHKLALLADGHISGDELHRLVELQEAAVERATHPPKLSPMEESDAEDALADWFDDRGVPGGYDLAPVLVGGGIDSAFLDTVADKAEPEHLEGALRWLTYTVETEGLMREISDSVTRISTLVGAAKQYSQMDRAPYQRVDVHDGIDSTLVMLTAKIGDGVTVVKDYDRSLPQIPAYAAELNQVWTNLIDNALQAMGGQGTLTVRTGMENDDLLVSIGDTGPGVPPELRRRIFEPFFTTKAPGEGTGLGLDISWRIVVTRHHGDLRLQGGPGDTRFEVRLPLIEPAD
jgi:signal transduction histidine kinase